MGAGCGCSACGRRCPTSVITPLRGSGGAARRTGGQAALYHQAMVYGRSAFESFTSGLGTGAFLAF